MKLGEHHADLYTRLRVTDYSHQLQLAGTIFLDEIGHVTESRPMKLLRVIQEREFDSYRKQCSGQIQVRIIAATSANPKAMVRKEEVPKDLITGRT